MLEPDVALTDFLLAGQNGAFAVLLLRQKTIDDRLRRAFSAFFAALGASALFGGIWHGFYSSGGTDIGPWVWLATMTALAMTAAALWLIAAACLPYRPWTNRLRTLAGVQLVAQTLIATFLTDAFLVGALGMLPAIVMVSALYVRDYLATRSPRLLMGLGGLVLASVSTLVIFAGISLHPVWLTPNALYHLLQVVACWMLFLSVGSLNVGSR
ncbi:DUF6962 family protein [Tropicimonas marinistellae]|uniref:DUF6962 family protein n=1 Tax=Tropicimonas marinistellae TaxID=1739787 RepID=UPI0008364931|nr:hypothetical protein [Tropicimonas marinistellae]